MSYFIAELDSIVAHNVYHDSLALLYFGLASTPSVCTHLVIFIGAVLLRSIYIAGVKSGQRYGIDRFVFTTVQEDDENY